MPEPYNGPFKTRDEAFAHPEVRRIYQAMHESPHRGVGDAENLRLLERACEAAGVQLGAYDLRVLRWLASWEAEMCVVVAGLVARAGICANGSSAQMPRAATSLTTSL